MDVFKTLILDTPDSLENISGVLPVVNGGTGADNVVDARANLGLGTMSTQNANAVAITGGSITGLTALGVVDNTTLGSSNTDTVTFNARAASEFTPATDNTYDLGRVGHEWRDLYIDGTANIDSLIADTADINGGTIDATTIGATTPANGTFSQVNSTGAIIATGAGSFGDDTDVTGDLTVTGSVTATKTANDAGAVALLLQNADGNAGIGSRLAWRLDNLANEWGYINVNRVGGGATAQMDFGINGAAYSGAASVGMSLTSTALTVTGNVGIGTTSPATKLHVQTATNGGIVVNDGTVNGIIYGSTTLTNSFAVGTTSNHPLIFGTNNTFPQMTLATSGNVGIGTTSPTDRLHVSGALRVDSWIGGNSATGKLILYGDRESPDGLTIVDTGNVGIGISSPTNKLEVAGTNAAPATSGSAANGASRLFGAGSGAVLDSGIDGTYAWMQVRQYNNYANSYNLAIQPNGGNVGIGTTSPAYQLQLSTDSAAKPSTNTWTIASDARIKDITGEYTKGLDAVLSLRPVTYRYNGKAGMVDDGEDKISIIAQEAITAFPECVGSYMTKLNEDDEEETEVLNWNGHALTFALVNSIKELAARIEALENN